MCINSRVNFVDDVGSSDAGSQASGQVTTTLQTYKSAFKPAHQNQQTRMYFVVSWVWPLQFMVLRAGIFSESLHTTPWTINDIEGSKSKSICMFPYFGFFLPVARFFNLCNCILQFTPDSQRLINDGIDSMLLIEFSSGHVLFFFAVFMRSSCR